MHQHNNRQRRSGETRRGSTLIIVVALLGLLSIMGLTFYTFARQERSAARDLIAIEP